MKVLQVINSFYPPYSSGGAAFVANNISKTLSKRGHEVTVYTTNILSRDKLFHTKQNPKYYEGVKVYYFSNIIYKPSTHSYFSNKLIRAMRKNISNYDIVQVHGYRNYISLVTSYYANKNNIPYILQAHGCLPRIMTKQRLKYIFDVFFGYRLLSNTAKVIALTQVEAKQYRRMGVPEEKITIIPNGIDLSEYENLSPKGSFKKKFGIKEEEKIVLYLGRLHKIKGIDVLVKAYANVIEKLDHVKLVIVGPDDGHLGEIQALIKDLVMEKNILITGPLYGKDKLEAYVDADVYVLPSRYEAFPMSVLEAYSCGKPVIASRVGGLSDLIIEGETGLLFYPEDIEQLTNNIFLLLNDSDRAEKMGLNGRQFVKENFTIGNVVDRIEVLYKEIATLVNT